MVNTNMSLTSKTELIEMYIVKIYLLQLYVCVCVCDQLLSLVQLFVTTWTVAHQAPLFMKFSKQEYWSGLLFPPPRDLPNIGLEPRILHCR